MQLCQQRVRAFFVAGRGARLCERRHRLGASAAQSNGAFERRQRVGESTCFGVTEPAEVRLHGKVRIESTHLRKDFKRVVERTGREIRESDGDSDRGGQWIERARASQCLMRL